MTRAATPAAVRPSIPFFRATHRWAPVFGIALLLVVASAEARAGIGSSPMSNTVSDRVSGSITVKGTKMDLEHAHAFEIDSESEPGYLDVLVVLTSRPITAEQAKDREELERLSFKEGLAGIRLLLNPDCKPRALATYHPQFTVFLDGAGEHRWQPSAFDDNVAGRLSTPGRQEALGQTWEYDVEFSVPSALDPEATTVP